VTQKAFETCGTPRLITKREAPAEAPASIQTLKRNLKKSELEKLMADLRKAVKPSQKFWSRMPYAMCSNTASSDDSIFFDNGDGDAADFGINHGPGGSSNNDECWNGQENGSYDKPVVEDGLHNQARNPEVRVLATDDASGAPSIVREQVYQLRGITNQLKMAHKGQDVEWWDRELERRDKATFEGSGDLEGHEDDEDFAEGSGGYSDLEGGDDDSDDVESSGDLSDDEDGLDKAKVDEPWRPWSPEEIDVIELTPAEATTTARPTTAGSRSVLASGYTILAFLVCFTSSFHRHWVKFFSLT
jgi:hypothetical protein